MTAIVEEPGRDNRLVSPFPIFEFNRTVLRARTLEEIFAAALDCVRASLGIEKASIFLFDDAGVMRFRAWSNLSEAYRTAIEGRTTWTPDTVNVMPVLIEDVRAFV